MQQVDLQSTIGLPVKLASGELEFSDKFVKVVKQQVYSLDDMRQYFLNPLSLFPRNIYEEYKVQDAHGALKAINVGLAVYKINPQLIGIEYAKTRGCFLDQFPRVLEVNYGRVMVVLQKAHCDATGKNCDVLIAKLGQRDKLVIPPNYGVTVVNNTTRASVCTIVHNLDEGRLFTLKRYKGGAVYVIYRNKQAEVVKNPHYRNFGSYAKISQQEIFKNFDISPKTPLIKQFLRKYEKYNWFYKPNSFDWCSLYTVQSNK